MLWECINMQVDNAVKEALLEAMDELHRVCEENGLKYYLIGGSLIGAIRHKGCIPWDDDLDVAMLEDDFKKLLEISKEFKEGFKLRHIKNDPFEPEPIARVENASVIVDEGYFSGAENGVFVDVFCLKDTFLSGFLQKVHFKTAAFSRVLLRLKTKSYRRKKYSAPVFSGLRIASILLIFFPKTILNMLMDKSEKMGAIGGRKEKVANLHGCWKTKEVAPKSLFEKRKLYTFEGRQYWSIEDADAWLCPIYGDYMKLPPIEDRQPKHIDKIISVNGVKVDS